MNLIDFYLHIQLIIVENVYVSNYIQNIYVPKLYIFHNFVLHILVYYYFCIGCYSCHFCCYCNCIPIIIWSTATTTSTTATITIIIIIVIGTTRSLFSVECIYIVARYSIYSWASCLMSTDKVNRITSEVNVKSVTQRQTVAETQTYNHHDHVNKPIKQIKIRICNHGATQQNISKLCMWLNVTILRSL